MYLCNRNFKREEKILQGTVAVTDRKLYQLV